MAFSPKNSQGASRLCRVLYFGQGQGGRKF
jgi:hypothetical protein